MTRPRTRVPAAVLGVLLLCALALTVGRAGAAPACTITWVGGVAPNPTAWHQASNWDLNRLPADGDVACLGAGSTVVHSTGTTTVKAVVSQATFTVSGGVLNLTGTGADESSVSALTLSNGTIGGAGALAVTGTLSWTGGTMTDAGTTRIAPGATLVRELENTVFLSAGRVLAVEGTMDLRTDRFISTSGSPLIKNTGTIVKSAGAGTATIQPAVENDGSLRSDAGILDLRGGDGPDSSSGSFGAAATAGEVRLGTGTFDLAHGAALLGDVTMNGATVAVANGATATASGDNKLATGELGGTGTLNVTDTLRWTGGTMADAGTTRVALGAILAREEENTAFLADGRVIEVLGTFDLRTDRFISVSGAAPLIHNDGTLLKSAGVGTATIAAALENDGVVRAHSGILDLRGGDGPGSSDGDYGTAMPLGTVSLAVGTVDLANGADLLGNVNLSGATVDVAPGGTATASGTNSLTAGTLGGTGALNVTGTLSWTAGTMSDAGVTRVQPGATVVREQENTAFLSDGRLLEVHGTLDLRTDRFISVSGAAPLIHNLGGTVVKSAGPATATIAAALENDGAVRADSGTLDLRGGDGPGSSSGNFGAAAATGTVSFGTGTTDLADGAALLGGTVMRGGVADVAASAVATASGANELENGAFGGTGTLRVTGTLSWTGGSMRGAGTSRVEVGATLVREEQNTVFLENGRVLDVDGLLDLRTDRLISVSGAAPLIRNDGTIRKSAGAGTATISAALENDGVLDSQAGTLELRGGDGGGSSAGEFGGAAGEVSLGSGVFDLADDARFLGGVALEGATANVVSGGAATVAGNNSFSAGIVGGTGTLALVSGTFGLTGGTMRDAGTTSVGPAATLSQQGNLSLQDGRVLENAGLYELRGSSQITRSGVAPLVHNTGTIERKAGSGGATIGAALDNDGTVVGGDGLLILNAGDGAREQNGTFRGVDPGFVTFTAGAFDLGAGTSFAGRVRLGGGQLTIPAGVTVSATGSNEQTFAILDGAGTLSVDGPFTWSGGTMQGSGKTIVPAGRTLTLVSCCQTLSGTRRLEVAGALVADGGRLFADDGTVLANTGAIELVGGGPDEELSGDGLLLNSGSIEKTAGAGTSTVDMALANTGSVAAATGTLSLGGGDGDGAQSGDFGGGPGQVVFASGEWDLAGGTRFLGGVGMDGASLAVASGYTLPVAGAARLADGSLAGPGNVDFKGTLAWNGGAMEGTSLTTIAPAAVVTVDAGLGGVELLDGRLLLNQGRIDLLSGDLLALDSTVVNQGLLDFKGDADITGSFGAFGETLLHNTGTLRKSAGGGESELGADVDNDGTIEAAAGRLALRGELLNYSAATASLASGAFVARDATLELPGEPLQANAATIVLDGVAARLVARPFFGGPDEDALSDLARNAGAGELRLEGGADLTTPGGLRNAGLLVVGEGSTLIAGGAFVQSGGRTELRGPSSLLEATAYTQTAGTLLVETAAAGTGRVDAAGAAALAGNLAVETRAGFTPAPGTTFRFLDAAAVTGTFGALLEVTPGIDYAVDYDATGATLRVAGATPIVTKLPEAAPEPPSTPLALDDRALAKLGGAWVRRASPGFYQGTYTMSSKKGARLVRAGVEARYVGLLVSTCRRCGVVEVYWDGRLLRRVRLAGRPERRLIDVAVFPTARTGTVTIRVASARRQVRIDGLVATT